MNVIINVPQLLQQLTTKNHLQPDLPPTLAEEAPAEPLPDQNNATEKTENERENETKPELAGSTASSNTSEDPSEPAANEGHIEVEVKEEKENVTAVDDEKPAREERPEPKREKKVSKKRSKKMEKKAKQPLHPRIGFKLC